MVDTLERLNVIWKLYWVDVVNRDKKSDQDTRNFLTESMNQLCEDENIHIKLSNFEQNYVFY